MTLRKPSRGTAKAARRARKRRAVQRERAAKAACRLRDGGCRFPLCGCRRSAGAEVSHLVHRGMGGNPSGDRSTTRGMLCLCRWRHRESRASMDREGIYWEGLTGAGADGPIRWMLRVDVGVTEGFPWSEWNELARELEAPCDGHPGRLEPMTHEQLAMLQALAKMGS
jgi:hypothetical protein